MINNNDDVLGGFSAVFDQISTQIDPDKLKDVDVPAVADEDDNKLFGGVNGFGVDPVVVDDEEADDPIPGEEAEDDEVEDGGEPAGDSDDDKETESVDAGDATVVAFFDALAETAGWGDISDEEKPKTVESLIDYMKSVVEANSAPSYSSEEVAAMDEYVRNGGKIENYIASVAGSFDFDNLDIENETVQKAVIREFMVEKGYTEAQIKRKLEKYEDADILEDEAIDAVESLKEIKEEKKKALLDEQRNAHATMIEEQQKFYNNVIGEIEALTDIRGIKIPKQDKQALTEYIFKVESDGKTKYQREYAKSTKNLIESAYFTMKGDSLLSSARKSGETSAVEKLRNTLNSNKVSGSTRKIDNRSAQPLWAVASKQLLNRPQ